MYENTRWAAPGGGGHGLAGWLAIAVGLIAAIWVFYIVPHWWLALPAAILAWLLGTSVVGALWAAVRRLIEIREGIK
jgi:hypothetical protein